MRKCLVVLLSMLIGILGHADSKPVSIPFTTNSDGLVVISAKFGSIDMHVFFDTGAGVDVIAPSLERELGGKAVGQFTGFRMGGERLEIPLYRIPQLTVGPLHKRNALVATWEALDSEEFKKLGVSGIISLDDFRERAVTFDFQHRLIVFESRDSLKRRRKSGVSVPLALDDMRGITLDSFAMFDIGSQPGQCEIDMGSPSATISTRYLQPLGVNINSPGVTKHVSKNIAGATVVRYDTQIPRIALLDAPKIALQNPKVAFSDIIYDCVIGVDFWQGRTVTFDVAHRELTLSSR